ncbi:DUF3156 family protein [Pseudomonas tohonis]|uniref:DUF3156 family protein n=1 Tax=Pseudomonas tohonis TaxID=2725477 RepID=UPI00255BA913|nr:DUF3156 family protein [Pseudomonas tohonis]
MLLALREFFGNGRAPSGYRPGATLALVRRNLGGLAFEALELGRGRFTLEGGLSFEARERTQSELLMHLVLTEFELRVPTRSEGVAVIDLRHTGVIRRQGLACVRRHGNAPELAGVIAALEGDEALRAALMPLDFKRVRIERDGDHWQVRLEHMGASEVVNRMPAFRRYIRLDDAQQAHLLNALPALARVLAGF